MYSGLCRSLRHNSFLTAGRSGGYHSAPLFFDCFVALGVKLAPDMLTDSKNSNSRRQPAPASSQLDKQETSVQLSIPSTYQAVFKRSCSTEWQQTYALYKLLDDAGTTRRAEFLQKCRTEAYFHVHRETRQVKVASNHCNLRWCPLCSQAKSRHIAAEVNAWLPTQSHPKFMTLTLKHTAAPLRYQIECLYKAFRNLRRNKFFKKHCTGGIWFFQIKRSGKDGLWHPHLHCIITGGYIDGRKLSREWLKVSHSSKIVDIQSVKKADSVSQYVARYCARPSNLEGLPIDMGIELIQAMEGLRICGKWGTGRTLNLRPKSTFTSTEWECVGSWSTIRELLRFHESAKAIVSAWRTGTPLPQGVSLHSVDEFIANKMFEIACDSVIEDFY